MQVHQEQRAWMWHTLTFLSVSVTHTHTDTIFTSHRGAAQSSDITNLWPLISWWQQKTSKSPTLWYQEMSEVKVQTRGRQPTRIGPKSRPKAESGTSQLVCPAHVQTRPRPNNPLPSDRHGLLHHIGSFHCFTLVHFVFARMTNNNSSAPVWIEQAVGFVKAVWPRCGAHRSYMKEKGKEIVWQTRRKHKERKTKCHTNTEPHTGEETQHKEQNSAQQQQWGTHPYMEKRFLLLSSSSSPPHFSVFPTLFLLHLLPLMLLSW